MASDSAVARSFCSSLGTALNADASAALRVFASLIAFALLEFEVFDDESIGLRKFKNGTAKVVGFGLFPLWNDAINLSSKFPEFGKREVFKFWFICHL